MVIRGFGMAIPNLLTKFWKNHLYSILEGFAAKCVNHLNPRADNYLCMGTVPVLDRGSVQTVPTWLTGPAADKLHGHGSRGTLPPYD